MQLFPTNSSSSPLSLEKQLANTASNEKILLPMAGVKNTGTQLQTSSNIQNDALASSSKNTSIPQQPQTELSAEIAFQTEQLSLLLENINDSVYFVYDENEVNSETSEDFTQHCHQIEIMTCTSEIKAAWYKVKNRVAHLMHSDSKADIRKIALEKYHLKKNIEEACKASINYHQLINENPSLKIPKDKTLGQYYKELKKQSNKARKTLTDVLNLYANSLHQYNEKEENVIKNITEYFLEGRIIVAFQKIHTKLSNQLIKNLILSAAKTNFSNAVNFRDEIEFKTHRIPVSQEFWQLLDSALPEAKKFKNLFDKFLLTSWKSDDIYINMSRKTLKKTKDEKELYTLTSRQLFEEMLKCNAAYIIHCILQLTRAIQHSITRGINMRRYYDVEIRKTIARLNNCYSMIYYEAGEPYITRTQENLNELLPDELETKFRELNKDISQHASNYSFYKKRNEKDIPLSLAFINQILTKLKEKGSIDNEDLSEYKASVLSKYSPETSLNLNIDSSENKRGYDVTSENTISPAKKIRKKEFEQVQTSLDSPSTTTSKWHVETNPLRFAPVENSQPVPLTQQERLPCFSQTKMDTIDAECLGELFPELSDLPTETSTFFPTIDTECLGELFPESSSLPTETSIVFP